jgi:hypothetical protein
MLKCWSYLPKDRPTFHELTNKLWDLEHTGTTYVNLPGLMLQSIESEGMQKHYIYTVAFLCNGHIYFMLTTELVIDKSSLVNFQYKRMV